VQPSWQPHYAARTKGKAISKDGIYRYLNVMQRGANMSVRNELDRGTERFSSVLVRPRELFGESLPELALVTAIVTAVITATISLSS
jgi:hypothetical protein